MIATYVIIEVQILVILALAYVWFTRPGKSKK